jgi:hypothetical protein
VDWITFRDTQKTRDKTLQREVLKKYGLYFTSASLVSPLTRRRSEPALFVLVYVFRMLPDKRSVALWRKRINIPAPIIRKNADTIAAKRRELRAAEAQYVIKIR